MIVLMNWKQCHKFAKERRKRLLGRNTRLIVHKGCCWEVAVCYSIRYHNTDIITYHVGYNNRVTLTTGGYETQSTFCRLREFGFKVYQHRGKSFLLRGNHAYEMVDELEIDRLDCVGRRGMEAEPYAASRNVWDTRDREIAQEKRDLNKTLPCIRCKTGRRQATTEWCRPCGKIIRNTEKLLDAFNEKDIVRW